MTTTTYSDSSDLHLDAPARSPAAELAACRWATEQLDFRAAEMCAMEMYIGYFSDADRAVLDRFERASNDWGAMLDRVEVWEDKARRAVRDDTEAKYIQRAADAKHTADTIYNSLATISAELSPTGWATAGFVSLHSKVHWGGVTADDWRKLAVDADLPAALRKHAGRAVDAITELDAVYEVYPRPS